MTLKGFFAALLLLLTSTIAACTIVPLISNIKPNHATVGAIVEINGNAFGTVKGTVFFGSEKTKPADILEWTAKRIRVKVPATAKEGIQAVHIERDDGAESLPSPFTVDSSNIEGGQQLIVIANQFEPGLQVYKVADSDEGDITASFLLSLSLASPGVETTIRGIAAIPALGKIYVAVDRRGATEADSHSELVVLGNGIAKSATGPTLIDVGIKPTGLAVSPAGDRLFVASTASGMLTVVDTATDTVIDDAFFSDLGNFPGGFQPLNVITVTSPNDGLGAYLVTLAGNNWMSGEAEILTFAPSATTAEKKIVSHIGLKDTFLNGALAVSDATQKIWLLGDSAGFANLTLVDVFEGRPLDMVSFGPGGMALPGFANGLSQATDVLVIPDTAQVFVAFPEAGVAAFLMSAGSTQAVDALTPVEQLYAVADGPQHMAIMRTTTGESLDSILVTRNKAKSAARIPLFGGDMQPDFITDLPELSTLISTFTSVEAVSE